MEWINSFTPLGVLALVLFLLFDKVFPLVLKKNTIINGRNKNGFYQSGKLLMNCPLDREGAIKDLTEMKNSMGLIGGNVSWIKGMHDRFDDDGVPIWYSPKKQIEALLVETKQTNRLLSNLIDIINKTNSTSKR